MEGHFHKVSLIYKWWIDTQQPEESISLDVRHKGVEPVCQATRDFKCEVFLLYEPAASRKLFDTAFCLSKDESIWNIVALMPDRIQ